MVQLPQKSHLWPSVQHLKPEELMDRVGCGESPFMLHEYYFSPRYANQPITVVKQICRRTRSKKNSKFADLILPAYRADVWKKRSEHSSNARASNCKTQAYDPAPP
eukprot:1139681-Pelagomonas_calceolata.AAC.3